MKNNYFNIDDDKLIAINENNITWNRIDIKPSASYIEIHFAGGEKLNYRINEWGLNADSESGKMLKKLGFDVEKVKEEIKKRRN